MYKNQKGEIATFISIAALIGMAVLSFVTSNINTNIAQKQTTNVKADVCSCGVEEDISVCTQKEEIRYVSGYEQSCFDSGDEMGECVWQDDPNKPIYDTYEGECIAFGTRCSVCPEAPVDQPVDQTQTCGSGTCRDGIAFCEDGYENVGTCKDYYGNEGACCTPEASVDQTGNCSDSASTCSTTLSTCDGLGDNYVGTGGCTDRDGNGGICCKEAEPQACNIGFCASYGSYSCDPAYDQTDETCRDGYGSSVCCTNKVYTPVSCEDTSYTCRINVEDCNAFSNPGTYLQGESCTEINGGTGVCCKENPDSKPQQSGSSCSDSSYTCMPYNDCSEISYEKTYLSGGSCQTDDGTSGTCCKEAGASETAECTGSCFTETCTTVNRTGATGRCEEDKNCCAREEDLISASGDCESNGGQCIGEGSYDEAKQTRVSGKCPTGYGDASICVKDKSETDTSEECETAGGQCISGDVFDETKQTKISGKCPANLGEPNVCVKEKDATEKKKCEDLGGECKNDSDVDTKIYQKVDGATCEDTTQSCYKKTNEGGQGYGLINDTPQNSYSEGEIATITVSNVPSGYTEEDPAKIYFSVKDNGDGTWTYNVDEPSDVSSTVTPGEGYEVSNGND